MNLLLNYCSEISSSAIEDSNFLSNQGTSYTIKEHLIPLLFFPSCTQRSRFGTDFILSRARSFHAAFKSSLRAATCLPLLLSKPFLFQYIPRAIASSFCFVNIFQACPKLSTISSETFKTLRQPIPCRRTLLVVLQQLQVS